ncbi:RluA family pseudouridine synthase [Myxococcota bacterium]|nr:RluA family pseudouridine synthase [Myxococcota bacterium]
MDSPDIFLLCTTSGSRVDAHVAECTGESRERVKEALIQGLLTVNGRMVKASSRVKKGDEISGTLPPLPLSEAIPEKLPLTIVYQDEHLLVVDKKAGMVVHPAPGHDRGTLVNGLLGLGVFATELGDSRPGIVHRIDKDTSGLLVVSRTVAAREGLVEQFKVHSIKRQYLAIVCGIVSPAGGTWDTLHGRNPHHRLKFSSTVKTGKRAVTRYETVETFGSLGSLLRVTLSTGRTHQVRVHCTDHGHPLIGDPLYTRRGSPPEVTALGEKLGRQALHAALLGFDHPVTGEYLEFSSRLPEDMQQTILALRELAHD